MKTPKEPTPLQLFKQWKKTELASQKARNEQRLLQNMALNAPSVCGTRITVDGFIYELTTTKTYSCWNPNLNVTKLGSIEEFSKLIK